jgi:hypothetical protein
VNIQKDSRTFKMLIYSCPVSVKQQEKSFFRPRFPVSSLARNIPAKESTPGLPSILVQTIDYCIRKTLYDNARLGHPVSMD